MFAESTTTTSTSTVTSTTTTTTTTSTVRDEKIRGRKSWLICGGKSMENLWKTMENLWKTMEKIWKTHGKSMENHGKDMENHGKDMENHRKSMGKPWKRYGKPMENLWKTMENMWKTMEKIWKTMENMWKTMENIGNIIVDMWEIIPWNGWETIAIWGIPEKYLGGWFHGKCENVQGMISGYPIWKPLFLALLQVGGRPKRRSVALIQVNEIWQFTQMPAAHCDVSWRFYLIWIIWIYLDLTKSNSNHNSEDLFWNVFFTYAKSFHLGQMYKSM